MKTIMTIMFLILNDPNAYLTRVDIVTPEECSEAMDIVKGEEPIFANYGGIDVLMVKVECEAFGESI